MLIAIEGGVISRVMITEEEVVDKPLVLVIVALILWAPSESDVVSIVVLKLVPSQFTEEMLAELLLMVTVCPASLQFPEIV